MSVFPVSESLPGSLNPTPTQSPPPCCIAPPSRSAARSFSALGQESQSCKLRQIPSRASLASSVGVLSHPGSSDSGGFGDGLPASIYEKFGNSVEDVIRAIAESSLEEEEVPPKLLTYRKVPSKSELRKMAKEQQILDCDSFEKKQSRDFVILGVGGRQLPFNGSAEADQVCRESFEMKSLLGKVFRSVHF